MPEHGEIYCRKQRLGKTTYLKSFFWCAFHGEIGLLDCDDFDAAHGAAYADKARELRRLETVDFEGAQKLAA